MTPTTRADRVAASQGKPIPPYSTDPRLTFYCPQENLEALDEPRIRAFWDEIRERYQPPPLVSNGSHINILLLLPCTKTKPYLLSDEHTTVNRYLLDELGFAPVGTAAYPSELVRAEISKPLLHNGLLIRGSTLIQRMVISEPMGLVPYETVYYWADELSMISRYDDPGLFEHRGIAACPWRADSTAMSTDNGHYRWGPAEQAAYAQTHNRIAAQIAAALYRIHGHYAVILAYLEPHMTHRSFLSDTVTKTIEEMPAHAGAETLHGVDDLQPGLVQLVPSASEQTLIKTRLAERGLDAGEIAHCFSLAAGESTVLRLPESLAMLGHYLRES